MEGCGKPFWDFNNRLLLYIFYFSDITREFLEWLVENIKGSGFGSTWKTLVAYQKITRCKEDIGVERAYGAMFYTIGMFPRWVDFEFYNDQVHDFKYNYKTAVFYSDIVVPLLMEEVKVLTQFIPFIIYYCETGIVWFDKCRPCGFKPKCISIEKRNTHITRF